MGGKFRMDLREMDWEDMEWVHLAQDGNNWRALVNAVMNLREFFDYLNDC
jgi:hypothetical protein